MYSLSVAQWGACGLCLSSENAVRSLELVEGEVSASAQLHPFALHHTLVIEHSHALGANACPVLYRSSTQGSRNAVVPTLLTSKRADIDSPAFPSPSSRHDSTRVLDPPRLNRCSSRSTATQQRYALARANEWGVSPTDEVVIGASNPLAFQRSERRTNEIRTGLIAQQVSASNYGLVRRRGEGSGPTARRRAAWLVRQREGLRTAGGQAGGL